jgi:DNA-binding protein Alba
MNCVIAVITRFNSPNTKEVTLKTRGQTISRAVDVAGIVKHKFVQGLNVRVITTGTEQIKQEEGGTRSGS